jgi:hypothetical protein
LTFSSHHRFGEDAGMRIPVRESSTPDLSIPMQLGRQENFSLFLPKHRKLSKKLIEIFMGAKSIDELQVKSNFISKVLFSTNIDLFDYV